MAGSLVRLLKGTLLGAGIATVAGNSAVAETNADLAERNTIVVTGVRDKGQASGTKTDTPLIETPQTITVIDGDELARRNARSINQALDYVAGVSANQRGGTVTRYDQMYLRGFSPTFYLDGMRLIAGPYSTPQIDFNRVGHLDVVKGPASVLYGNSSPGGLVNLTSKTPEPTAFQRLEVAAGNFDTQLANIDINRPLDEAGHWLFRLVSGAQHYDGFTDMTESERTHISPMLTFAPSEHTSLTLIGAYQHDPKGGGYSGVPAFGSALPNPFGELPEDINTGDPDYEVFDRYQRTFSALFRHDFNERVSLRTNARFHNTELSYRQIYVAGFPTTGAGANRNTDFSRIIRGGGGADEDFDTITADTSLAIKFATGPLAHSVLVGVDYQNIDGENFQHFNTGETDNPVTSIPNLSLYAPSYRGVMPTRDLTRLSAGYTNNDTEREQIGFYVQDQIEIDRLQLIASGRYDDYQQDSLNKKNGVLTPLSQHAFTGRLGALYELPMGLAPFVSYSESFEPQTGTTYRGDPFDPVTGRQYEVGLKYQPQAMNALFTLAAYDLRRQKVPVGHPSAGANGIPNNAQIQIGEVKVQGVELEGRGEILPGFEVVLTGTYTDSEITRGAPASGVTPSTTGTRLLGAPVWMASTFLSYDFGVARPEGRLGGLSLGLGTRYVGGSEGTTTYAVINNVQQFNHFTTDSFVLVDALASYDLGRLSSALEGAQLALNVANLFDEKHVTACPFSNSCYFGASRTVVGTLRYEW
ncbi:ligand-gated channel [Steroidobacter agaridevorans]|uniref:Ligand-gated channel n=1 Tax=Steroidobacter agaridevorans TaxID=2695856 RepID=A0A829YKW9_9GAMM|nr:TonB-dependent siderophore receptor [Steroidobacter agaridevorans]GFE83890.1 ligand-gated channel [Steroidobacter agaridevorans]